MKGRVSSAGGSVPPRKGSLEDKVSNRTAPSEVSADASDPGREQGKEKG